MIFMVFSVSILTGHVSCVNVLIWEFLIQVCVNALDISVHFYPLLSSVCSALYTSLTTCMCFIKVCADVRALYKGVRAL